MPKAARPFNRQTLEQAFERMGELAASENKVVEISVYGGSALILSLDFRVATRDVDAVFESDRGFVRRAAQQIAGEFGWDANWINDGVKGFVSANDNDPAAKKLFRSYPADTGPGLRVFVASPAYLFAMKCLAMRIGGIEQSQDVEDIRALGKLLGVSSSEEALRIVSSYYPGGMIQPKTAFGLEEIFGRSRDNDPSKP